VVRKTAPNYSGW